MLAIAFIYLSNDLMLCNEMISHVYLASVPVSGILSGLNLCSHLSPLAFLDSGHASPV